LLHGSWGEGSGEGHAKSGGVCEVPAATVLHGATLVIGRWRSKVETSSRGAMRDARRGAMLIIGLAALP
jgi:hypothetical protein